MRFCLHQPSWATLVGMTLLSCGAAPEGPGQGDAPGGGTDVVSGDAPTPDLTQNTPGAGGPAGSDSSPSVMPQASSPSTPIPDGPIIETDEIIAPILEPNTENTDSKACASATAVGELQELALTFAFDVSGSMGKGDEPYHERTLKWDPVVAASKAFFSSSDVARVSASLVFFPIDEEDGRCDAQTYETPDVALTPLPSAAFGDAIDAITPESASDWRGGTPTLAVLNASAAYVRGLLDAGSTAKHAVVLVTDGMPQGCDDDEDDIEAVAAAAAELRDVAPTYVIGIANPETDEEPNPPDNVSNLTRIALEGGTTQALLIDTGDPTQTIESFSQIIASIRDQGLSCEILVPPPPPGQTFDKEKVNVTLVSDGLERALVYSPDCSTGDAWHFDDVEAPSKIVLCDETCAQTKIDTSSTLQVEFGCERRITTAK